MTASHRISRSLCNDDVILWAPPSVRQRQLWLSDTHWFHLLKHRLGHLVGLSIGELEWCNYFSSTIRRFSFPDQQLTALASYQAPTIRTATRVSLLLVRVCRTVRHRTYDETLAAVDLSENWKPFCSGVNWPRRTATVSCFVWALEISLLTYLISIVWIIGLYQTIS